MTGLLAAWMAEIAIITYRSAKQNDVGSTVKPIKGLALPSEYAATFIIYGALGFVPGQGQKVAAAIGWGIVVATLLNLWDPNTVGNAGGVAVIGGPSTKSASPVVVAPAKQTS